MANPEQTISLLLSPDSIDAQCLFAIGQARNPSHALATLIALQAFVAATVLPSERYTPAYDAIKSIIGKHAAAVRALLLAQQAAALAESIRRKDCAAIARIHGDISRNGFWQAAQQAIGQLDGTTLTAAREWAHHWCLDAKSRALAASGYPDALNFDKAGVSPHEYAAMTELLSYLKDRGDR